MPIREQNEELRGRFGSYIGVPSKEQLSIYFLLTTDDKVHLERMKKPSTKLGFAVQLATVRFLGVFPTNFKNIPVEVYEYLANQIEVNPSVIENYDRKATHSEHTRLIYEYYHYRRFSDVKLYLKTWLSNRCWMTTESFPMLFDMLLKKCLDEKIILPGISVLERFLTHIIEQTEQKLIQKLETIPNDQEKASILELLEPAVEPFRGATLKMDLLRSPLVDEGQKELIRGFSRLAVFQSFQLEHWNISIVPDGKRKVLANYVYYAKAQALLRLDEKKQIAYLVAFMYEYSKIAMDEQLLALSKYYHTLFRRAKNKEAKERLRTIKDLDRAAATLSDVVELVITHAHHPQSLSQQLFQQFQLEELQQAVGEVKTLVRNESEPVAIQELRLAYRKFRKFIPHILATLEFKATTYGTSPLKIWQVIQERFPKPIRWKDYIRCQNHFPQKWKSYIEKNPHSLNQCFVIAALEQLFQGLKKHDVFVDRSEKYQNPMDSLIAPGLWTKQKDVFIQQLSLPSTGEKAVQQVKKELQFAYQETLQLWHKSDMARLEEKNGISKIIVSRLKKTKELPQEKAFKTRVRELMPIIDLPDLLMEVNQHLALTQVFSIRGEQNKPRKDFDISLLATLLAEACNIGFSPVSKQNDPNLKYDRLVYMNHQYIRLDTLNAANHLIISAHAKLPLAQIWGSGDMASADGIRYMAPKRSLHTASNPKYFGRGRGITFYNFVSDHYIGFQGLVVSGTLRDSLFLLEGLLNQKSTLRPQQIMTDTAGYSDLIFGLFGLLGFQFSPRIANGQGPKIWGMKGLDYYGVLQNVMSKKPIQHRLIDENWEEILRVAASLKAGKVNATELIRSLQRDGNPTLLGRALTEYGKVYKTKHQLRYFSDESYARSIVNQLNKSESRHSLCRQIFYGKKGKIYQHYLDGMEEQLNALSIVVNAVIYWNTYYLDIVIEQMKEEGFDCSEEMLQKLSPLLSEHINFVGKYTFHYPEKQKDGSFRSLNFKSQ